MTGSLHTTPAQDAAWADLHVASDGLSGLLADLRTPADTRLAAMRQVVVQMERSALAIMPALIERREAEYPDEATWQVPVQRHPQPDPVLLLAVREWVWSMATEPGMPLLRQKRLNAVTTEILVALAAVQAYSSELHQRSPAPLVHTLSALWHLVAASWKLRPLLAEGT